MTLREKVIQGLRCCTTGDHSAPDCERCPYRARDTCPSMDALFGDITDVLSMSDFDVMSEILRKADPEGSHIVFAPPSTSDNGLIELTQYADSITLFFDKSGCVEKM